MPLLLWLNEISGYCTTMADLVDAVLQAASDKASSYKTTNVDKAIDVDVDAGNLLLIDNNKIETIELR